MLLGLRLNNIALIESLDLSFDKGFSVFTGETGAGKSIFLLAIDSLLGAGNSSSFSRLMRVGSNCCSIEGCFLIDRSVKNWLEENSFDTPESELYISRDWKAKGNRLTNRIRLNGEIINRKQLLSLRTCLIDLVQQGQSHQLLSPTYQLQMLDSFGASSFQMSLKRFQLAWNTWKKAKLNLTKAISEYKSIETELLNAQNFLDDLDSVQIQNPLEEQDLKKEQDRLVHGVRIQELLTSLFGYLKESVNDSPTASDLLLCSIHELKSLIALDASFSSELDLLLESHQKLEEFLFVLNKYQVELSNESNELEIVQNRIAEINRLKNRYKLDFDGLILKQRQSIHFLDSIASEHALEVFEKAEMAARLTLEKESLKITSLRKQYAKKLEEDLLKYLHPLGLEDIRFQIVFSLTELKETGADSINFLFSANPGQPLMPLAETASGGELSRFLLALKTVFSQVSGSTTLVFDEIDSGVSGRISTSIAKLLKEISAKKQVFCITHQPVIAASADFHFSVSKTVDNGVTNSKVLLLEEFRDRQSELAKLAGGTFVEASAYAASLLDNKAA